MKRIDIYIMTGIRGPRRQSGKTGYVAEYITASGQEATTDRIWDVEEMNERESVLAAVSESLDAVKTGNKIILHTDSEWVVTAINRWLPGWIRQDWKNARGEEIKYRGLFGKLAGRQGTDIIRAEKGTGRKYGPWLETQVRRNVK